DVENATAAGQIKRALEPETSLSTGSRARVSIQNIGRRITLHIKAKDTAALQAAINSYGRWVHAAAEVLRSLRASEERKI
ncbi:MAG: KEOPS complex subunit Pcc1, partial [Candidatus Bathyarchaeia archaeon]